MEPKHTAPIVIASLVLLCAGAPVQAATGENSNLTVHRIHLKGTHTNYTVDVEYPQFAGASPETVAALNRAIKHLVNTNIPAVSGTDQWKNAFSCKYHVCLTTPEVLSIDFEFHDYFGGAHGLTRHVPFNYQIEPELKPLTLRSVLDGRISYRRLSNLCWAKLRPELPVVFDDQLRKRDFETFTIDKNGLTFRFPESSITAYSYGNPTVFIPYKKFGTMLSHESVVRHL